MNQVGEFTSFFFFVSKLLWMISPLFLLFISHSFIRTVWSLTSLCYLVPWFFLFFSFTDMWHHCCGLNTAIGFNNKILMDIFFFDSLKCQPITTQSMRMNIRAYIFFYLPTQMCVSWTSIYWIQNWLKQKKSADLCREYERFGVNWLKNTGSPILDAQKYRWNRDFCYRF